MRLKPQEVASLSPGIGMILNFPILAVSTRTGKDYVVPLWKGTNDIHAKSIKEFGLDEYRIANANGQILGQGGPFGSWWSVSQKISCDYATMIPGNPTIVQVNMPLQILLDVLTSDGLAEADLDSPDKAINFLPPSFVTVNPIVKTCTFHEVTKELKLSFKQG
jgi:hypothetical protein